MREANVGTACDQVLAELIADALGQDVQSAAEIAGSWPTLDDQPSSKGHHSDTEPQEPTARMANGTTSIGASAHASRHSAGAVKHSASRSYTALHDMRKSYERTHTITAQNSHTDPASEGDATAAENQAQQQLSDLPFEQRLVTPPPIALGDAVMRDLERQEAAIQEELAQEAEQAEMKLVKEEWALDQALKDAGVYTEADAAAAAQQDVQQAAEKALLNEPETGLQLNVQGPQSPVSQPDAAQNSENTVSTAAQQVVVVKDNHEVQPGEPEVQAVQAPLQEQSVSEPEDSSGIVHQLPRVDSQEMMRRAEALDSPLSSAKRVTPDLSAPLTGDSITLPAGVAPAGPSDPPVPSRVSVSKGKMGHLYEQLYPASPDFPPQGLQNAALAADAGVGAEDVPQPQEEEDMYRPAGGILQKAGDMTAATLATIASGIASLSDTAADNGSTGRAIHAGAAHRAIGAPHQRAGTQGEPRDVSFRFVAREDTKQEVGYHEEQQAATPIDDKQGQHSYSAQEPGVTSSWDASTDMYYTAQQERSRHIAEQLAKLQEESRMLQEKSRALQDQASAIEKEASSVMPGIAVWQAGQQAAAIAAAGPKTGQQQGAAAHRDDQAASRKTVAADQSHMRQPSGPAGYGGRSQQAKQAGGGVQGGQNSQGLQSARATIVQNNQSQGQHKPVQLPPAGKPTAVRKPVVPNDASQQEKQKGPRPSPRQLLDYGAQSDPGAVPTAATSPTPPDVPPPSFTCKPALTWGLPKKPGAVPQVSGQLQQPAPAARTLPPLISSESPDVLPHHGYPSQAHHTAAVDRSYSDGAELRREHSSSSTAEPLLPRWSDQVSTTNNSPVTSPYRHLQRFNSPLKTHPSPDSKERLQKAADKAAASPPEGKQQSAVSAVQQQQQQQQQQQAVGFTQQGKVQGGGSEPTKSFALPMGNAKPRKFLPEVRLPLLLQPAAAAAAQKPALQTGAAVPQQGWGGPQQLQPLMHDMAQRMHVTWGASAAAPAQAMPASFSQQAYQQPQMGIGHTGPMQMYPGSVPGMWAPHHTALAQAAGQGMDMMYSPVSGAYMHAGPLQMEHSSSSVGVGVHARPVPHKAGGSDSGKNGQPKSGRTRHAAGKATQASVQAQQGHRGAAQEDAPYMQSASMAPHSTFLPPLHAGGMPAVVPHMNPHGMAYGQGMGMSMGTQQVGMPGMPVPMAPAAVHPSGRQAGVIQHTPRQHDVLKAEHMQLPPLNGAATQWGGMVYPALDFYGMYGIGPMAGIAGATMYSVPGNAGVVPAWHAAQHQAVPHHAAKRQGKPAAGKPAFRTY